MHIDGIDEKDMFLFFRVLYLTHILTQVTFNDSYELDKNIGGFIWIFYTERDEDDNQSLFLIRKKDGSICGDMTDIL